MSPATGDPQRRLFAESTELLALAYGGDPTAAERAATVLAGLGAAATPHAAYAWFCAGEAVLAVDVELARARLARAVELAESTGASFVAGVAGASKASIDARLGDPSAAAEDYRRLITHWRRAGMWSTQWTMLRSIAALLARLEPPGGRSRAARRDPRDERRPPHLRRRRARPGPARRGAPRDARRHDVRGGARPRRRPGRRRRGRAGAARARGPGHQRGCSPMTPSTDLPTISWVIASLPGWNPPQRTSR